MPARPTIVARGKSQSWWDTDAAHPGDHHRSGQCSQRSEECNTPAGPWRHHLSTKQVTRWPRTPRTDRSRPGVSGGHRQTRGNDPEAWTRSEQRPRGRHPAVGQHLPLVAAGALSPQPAGGIRAHPGYDTASYKEGEERSPAGSPVPIRMALPIAVAARAPSPVRARRPKASKAMAALTRKLAGAESGPRGDVKGLIG
jgi:hypothetical protein